MAWCGRGGSARSETWVGSVYFPPAAGLIHARGGGRSRFGPLSLKETRTGWCYRTRVERDDRRRSSLTRRPLKTLLLVRVNKGSWTPRSWLESELGVHIPPLEAVQQAQQSTGYIVLSYDIHK